MIVKWWRTHDLDTAPNFSLHLCAPLQTSIYMVSVYFRLESRDVQWVTNSIWKADRLIIRQANACGKESTAVSSQSAPDELWHSS
jgi:hypothetical protein